jgi:hypothetical protein
MQIRGHRDSEEAPFAMNYCMINGIALGAHTEHRYEAFRIAALIDLSAGSQDRRPHPETAKRD